ncbi:Imm40 family immunity protein [Mechercharimyces sp. CAU 1602]|uniref:Imm40 family immunity protein n=1 Tax=Mechercharimyces sp. CAU 1602 TaxID=2973933 RepID=UPI0021627022|nr:Imm40 family immunity protein [Mechercharimyces sp. CAU 1602]MCS1350905.1 Imm40 family immunity protein [Mechercharimyces sp. CAU 1602]
MKSCWCRLELNHHFSLPNDYPEELLSKACRLDSVGVHNYVWGKDDALKVMDYLTKIGFAILGGDVYRLENDGFRVTYDNWYCNKDDNETWDEYVLKSKKIAIGYIEKYSEKHGLSYYYALVIGDASKYI